MVNQPNQQSVQKGGSVQREYVAGRPDQRFQEASACLRDIFSNYGIKQVTRDYIQVKAGPGVHYSRANIEVYPGYTQLRKPAPPPQAQGGGIRNKITEFSKKSRIRLLKLLNSLETPLLGWQTFTFADDVLVNKNITQRAIFSAKVVDRLRYHAEKAGVFGVWRREWEPRKSGPLKGELAPHIHFMYTRKGLTERRLGSLARYLAGKWVRLTGTDDPRALDVAIHKRSYEWLSTHRKAIAYVSKYMAKPEKMPEGESLGRAWGRIGKLPTVEGEEVEVPHVPMVYLKRLLRRWLPKRSRRRMARGINHQSTFLLIDCKTLTDMVKYSMDRTANEVMEYYETFP